MKAVFYILLATVLTFSSAYAMGLLLLSRLKVRLSESERRFFAFIAGSALLSTLVFLITAAGFARKSVFLVFTLPVIAVGIWKRGGETAGSDPPQATLPWRLGFWIVFSVFTWVYLGNALLPETSPDGASYHVALPALYLRAHHFPHIATNLYANLSQGVEMLFLYAFSIGRHSAAAMVHFLFLLALPFGIVAYGRRIGRPRAGIAAALLVYLSPVAGRDGTIAYVDVAAAATAFALFYALQIWRSDRRPGLAVIIGLLAGFGYGIKYTLFVSVIYAAVMMIWWSWREWRTISRQWVLAGGCALAMMSPWLVKNTIYARNPVAPFFNDVFPNPYMYASVEQDYAAYFRHMDGVSYFQIPMEATIRGERLTGVLGPVFLLVPLALAALRLSDGRQLLLASAVFLAPYFGNIGTRFLLPTLPFASLAMCLALDSFPAVLVVVLLAHAVLSWPAMVERWSGKYAWRLPKPDWAAALRLEPEAEYLRKARDDSGIAALLELNVPARDLVYSPAMANSAYQTRNLVGTFESRLGSRINDMFYRVTVEDMRTTLRLRYRFAEAPLRRVRVVLTNRDPRPALFSEIHVLRKGLEVPRTAAWRLQASVNPWDVQSAFDASPITVWTVGQSTIPGVNVQISFGVAQPADEVSVDMPKNQDWVALRIEGDHGSGEWINLADHAGMQELPWPPRMRRAAAEQMKSEGINWIVSREGDGFSDDLSARSAEWGAHQVAAAKPYRLWRID